MAAWLKWISRQFRRMAPLLWALPQRVPALLSDSFFTGHSFGSAEQAAYIDVPVDGPFKPDHYRY